VPRRTPSYRLIELHLGTDLEAFVTERRAVGETWRAIAAEISERTGVALSHINLFRWFNEPNGDEAVA
jgi:hypothetical protein